MSIATRSDLVINEVEIISNDDGLSMPTLDCYNITEYKPIRLEHKWIIRNFHSIITSMEQKICLKSEIFVNGVVPEVKWRMCIFPCGGNLEGTTNPYLFMEVTSTSQYKKLTFKAKHKYTIKSYSYGVSNWYSDIFINTISLHPNNPIFRCSIFCIPISRIDNYFYRNYSLDICCEMEIIPDDKGIFCKGKIVKPPMDNVPHYVNYTSQFKKMYDSSSEVDCQIICNGTILSVHKFMLIAHSSVFNAMFKHKETKESEEKTIKIVDAELPALKMMIDYIYSGMIPELLNDDEIIDLLQLADKYDIKPLNHLCQDRLKLRLTKSNVCELLIVSEACKAQSLMDACIKLVAKNLKHIVESEK